MMYQITGSDDTIRRAAASFSRNGYKITNIDNKVLVNIKGDHFTTLRASKKGRYGEKLIPYNN